MNEGRCVVCAKLLNLLATNRGDMPRYCSEECKKADGPTPKQDAPDR